MPPESPYDARRPPVPQWDQAAPHPLAHRWPAYTPPPPKPETTLQAPLIWTAVFSFVGVIAFVVLVAVMTFLAYLLIFLLVASISGDAWDFWGEIGSWELVGALAGPIGLFVLAGTAVVFAVCAGVLLLMRRSPAIRRWAPVLQGLAACGFTYLGGTTLLTVLGQVASLVNR